TPCCLQPELTGSRTPGARRRAGGQARESVATVWSHQQQRARMERWRRKPGFLVAALLAVCGQSVTAHEPSPSVDDVIGVVRRLSGAAFSQRQQAEAALLDWGPQVLP